LLIAVTSTSSVTGSISSVAGSISSVSDSTSSVAGLAVPAVAYPEVELVETGVYFLNKIRKR